MVEARDEIFPLAELKGKVDNNKGGRYGFIATALDSKT